MHSHSFAFVHSFPSNFHCCGIYCICSQETEYANPDFSNKFINYPSFFETPDFSNYFVGPLGVRKIGVVLYYYIFMFIYISLVIIQIFLNVQLQWRPRLLSSPLSRGFRHVVMKIAHWLLQHNNLDSGKIAQNLEKVATKLITWFTNNRMKANPDKYHFLLTGENEQTLSINDVLIKSSKVEKILGITIDNKLNFQTHTNNLCNKVSQKLKALTRISNYIKPDQRRLIMKAFITSQFGYCSLVWMFHSRRINNRINRLHERPLRLTYND